MYFVFVQQYLTFFFCCAFLAQPVPGRRGLIIKILPFVSAQVINLIVWHLWALFVPWQIIIRDDIFLLVHYYTFSICSATFNNNFLSQPFGTLRPCVAWVFIPSHLNAVAWIAGLPVKLLRVWINTLPSSSVHVACSCRVYTVKMKSIHCYTVEVYSVSLQKNI